MSRDNLLKLLAKIDNGAIGVLIKIDIEVCLIAALPEYINTLSTDDHAALEFTIAAVYQIRLSHS